MIFSYLTSLWSAVYTQFVALTLSRLQKVKICSDLKCGAIYHCRSVKMHWKSRNRLEKKTFWNLLLICFSKVIMSLKAFIKAVRQLLNLRSNNYAIGIMCLFPDTWFASGSVSLRSLHFTAIFMISVCTECWNVSNLVLQGCEIPGLIQPT